MTDLGLPDGPAVQWQPVNGTDIAYIDTGGQAGRSALAMDFAMDHAMFDPRWRICAATSGYRLGPTRMGWYPCQLARLLVGLGARPTGAARASRLSAGRALRDVAGRVRRTADGAAGAGRCGVLCCLGTQAGLEDRSGPDQIISTWMQSGPERSKTAWRCPLGPGDWSDWFAKWASMDRQQLDWAYRCLMERDDLTARLPEIRCPVLVVHGTHDDAVPLEKASKYCSPGLGGRTSFVAIEGGRHASNITHSVVVNAAMRSFLASTTRDLVLRNV